MKGVIALIALFMMGCTGSAPAQYNYYRFNTSHAEAGDHGTEQPRIYLDQINIIGVADQQALVQYTGEHTVHIANYHYWAEHPKLLLTKETLRYLNETGFTPVLTVNASEFKQGEYRVLIEVSDLAGHYQQGAILRGSWHLYDTSAEGTTLLGVHPFNYSAPLDEDGFDALITAHQNNWQQLMKYLQSEIASVVR
ncbi:MULTISPECIES: PqiC family protein [unclassified Pseudoalteromonas]|uniref:PqiC family protein n=1 Tax=unclassified Pseudoalteromonas TaxID=194690 RepID=UPI002098430B|nr:PqiC family protein [Pseudoalteromonas sp. XMcav2-N]MCO7190522.1 PqiC family protein [Pseudoalteromonas sp. XMcav2-N]